MTFRIPGTGVIPPAAASAFKIPQTPDVRQWNFQEWHARLPSDTAARVLLQLELPAGKSMQNYSKEYAESDKPTKLLLQHCQRPPHPKIMTVSTVLMNPF